ncbi:MAG: neutral/alkaline non-lysosomal ceramidase N-terminal domain-containing protein, partial [Candidatus Marinimicrobia bacterium]|nr:neutral/alkaline non-lysosomal ceramidase N-terminal domain-containing protein [Candidatus Neomarinimicrobiota bacterium]
MDNLTGLKVNTNMQLFTIIAKDNTAKFIRRILLIVIAALVFIGGCIIKPVDRTPYWETDYYQTALERLDSLKAKRGDETGSQLKAGWAKVNITPKGLVPLSGYGSRKGALATGVHDSLWVRSFIFDNGLHRTAWVTLDALLVPPSVTKMLVGELPKIGFDLTSVFLTATHTHSSIGAWGESWLGKKFAGDFDSRIVDMLSSAVIKCIQQAEKNLEPAEIAYSQYDAGELVANRLVGEKGIIDPWFRVVTIKKASGSVALMSSFAAHATILPSEDLRFSRDYPGALVDSLEALDDVNFAAFAAGGVGSHRPKSGGYEKYDRVGYLARELTKKVKNGFESVLFEKVRNQNMMLFHVPLREPHWRISRNWRLNPAVFRWISEKTPHYIS